ncbi:hypothetical protein GN956_G9866 [Arapaima gigas]
MNFLALLSLLLVAPVCVLSCTCCFTCKQRCNWNSTRMLYDIPLVKTPHQSAKKIAGQSLATWTYTADTDANRIPQTIWTASCGNCSQGDKAAINYTITVLYRRPCPKNPQHYYLMSGTFDVTTGCTCTLPRLRQHTH